MKSIRKIKRNLRQWWERKRGLCDTVLRYTSPSFPKRMFYQAVLFNPRESKLIPVSFRYYLISRELIERDWNSAECCSDPMNGCPEDFAEDHERSTRGDRFEAECLWSKCSKIGLAVANFFLSRYDAKRQRQYHSLPWNADPSDPQGNWLQRFLHRIQHWSSIIHDGSEGDGFCKLCQRWS